MNNCVLCKKELESATPDDLNYQPYKGGFIQLTFCYGSCKFDCTPGTTVANGYICDDCSEKLIPQMTVQGYGFDGEKLELSIDDNGLPEMWSPDYCAFCGNKFIDGCKPDCKKSIYLKEQQ